MDEFFDSGQFVPLSGIRRISFRGTCNKKKTEVSNADDGSYQNNTVALFYKAWHQQAVCLPKTIYIWICVCAERCVSVCTYFLSFFIIERWIERKQRETSSENYYDQT